VLFSYLFSTFTGPQAPVHFPGAPYAAAAIMILAGLVIFVAKVARQGPSTPPVATYHSH
jgi:DHA1 family tetracycline resistance protein-like MFS transporter